MEWEVIWVVWAYPKYIWMHNMRLHLKDKLILDLFLFNPRLGLLFFGLRQWLIGLQVIFSLCGLIFGIITFLSLILDPRWKAEDVPLWLTHLLTHLVFFTLPLQLLIFFYWWFLKMRTGIRKNEVFNGFKLETILPKEWQADLKTLQERWIKQSYSCKNIRFLTIKHIFHMGLGYIQIQLENIWLPNNASTKEIE
jgi:hypothetical protein